MKRILIIDDDKASARMLELHLRSREFETRVAHNAGDGLLAAEEFQPQLIVLDIRMPGRSGLEILPEFKTVLPRVPVVMITAFHDMDSTIEAMKKGAEDYIHKPIDVEELDAAVDKLLKTNEQENPPLQLEARDGQVTMVGRSRVMKELFKTIGLVARSNTTVLITGESGTGKELVARAIHDAGTCPDGPFVVVNCAAVVETLLESDMFGHEKGAFTGAVSRQLGKFSLAEGGTIFLDEIGEMSLVMQAKLLRVLQYKEYTPLGAKESRTTNARIIAATNVNLQDSVKQGEFREDLFYRLQVVNIPLPPLREHMEDLADLVHVLLARINRELHSNITQINQDVLDRFYAYDWPGNVRELENLLMKAVALSSSNTLDSMALPPELGSCAIESIPVTPSTAMGELSSLDDMERQHVQRVLAATSWHRGQACEILGVSRPKLRRMIRQYELEPPDGLVEPEE